MQTPTQLFIDNEFRDGTADRLAMINPANEEHWLDVTGADADEVNRAVEGAQRAFDTGWRDFSPSKRSDLLLKIARLIRENLEELAQLEMRNIGKPIADARDEVGF